SSYAWQNMVSVTSPEASKSSMGPAFSQGSAVCGNSIPKLCVRSSYFTCIHLPNSESRWLASGASAFPERSRSGRSKLQDDNAKIKHSPIDNDSLFIRSKNDNS